MKALQKPFFMLTAADLMSRDVVSIPIDTPLRDAARKLAEAGIHGAPVVDSEGRCVGAFSSSDLARWARNQDAPPSPLPRTCQYQERLREVGGEVILCTLHAGACPLQQLHKKADGTTAIACAEPHAVPVDWQIVYTEALPEEDVRHYMTTCAVTAEQHESIVSLAKRMIDASVRRIIIVDEEKRPVGVVSTSDLIAALAERQADADDDR